MQETLFMWNFNFNQMKRLIYLFLTLFTAVTYGQADFPEGVQISGGQPTTTTDPYLTTTGSTGIQGKVPPEEIPLTIIPPTSYYTPVTPNLKGHLQGIDNALGDIPLTTAGNTTRIWFTGDTTTIPAGTFYSTNPTGKGTVANVSQSVTNDDNQKKYFTQDLIGNAFVSTTLFPPGVYAGNLSASTTPNSAQQRFTVELYKCDTNGTPIASGIAGAPVGNLGVTVILILDSGLLTLMDGSVTNVPVSAFLASQLTISAGERIRYHVSAEKVGTVASNITESVWYGNSFNSFLDVPTPITSSGVSNVSTVTGATVTVALDNLKTADQQVAGAGVTYGHITDGAQTIAGNKTLTGTNTHSGVNTFNNDINVNGFISGTVNKVLPTGNTFINQAFNLTQTGATSQLINRSTTSYNEDGIVSSVNNPAYDFRIINLKSTNQPSRDISGLIVGMQQNGTGSLSNMTGILSTVSGSGTGAVNSVYYYQGNTGPFSPSFLISNFIGLDLSQMPNISGGGVTNSTGINIGNVYASSLARGIQIGDVISPIVSRGIDIGVTSGTNKFNIYSQGTAPNYFNGNVLIGTTTSNGNAFRLTGTAELITTPTTSAGTYDILTRNTSTGVVEKVASSTFANDANVVHLTGTETIAGVKTFSSSPIVPTPTNSTDAVNKSYADGLVINETTGTFSNIQTLINASSAGTTINLKPNTIYAQDNSLILKEGITINGNGATLKRNAQTTTTLTVSANQLSTALTVSSVPSNWAIGDILQLYSDNTFTTSSYKEVPQILSIAGNVITLSNPLGVDATGANRTWAIGATVRKVFPQITSTKSYDLFTVPTAFTVKNLILDGNMTNNAGNLYWGVNMAVKNSGHAYFEGCQFLNMPNDNIFGSGYSLKNNTAANLNGSFIHQSADIGIGLSVLGGEISGNSTYDTNKVSSATINGHSEGVVTFSFTSGRTNIHDNRFIKSGEAVLGRISYGLAAEDGANRDLQFHNNYCEEHVKVVHSFIYGVGSNNVDNTQIKNNIFNDCGTDDWSTYASAINSFGSIKFNNNVLNNGTSISNIPDKMLIESVDVGNSIKGTVNTVPLFTSSNTIGNSILTQSSSKIGVGNASPSNVLDVNGGISVRGATTGDGGGLRLFSTNVNLDNISVVFSNSAAVKTFGLTMGKSGITNDGFGFHNRTDGTYPLFVSTSGVVNIPDLGGSGDRTVVADASGNLSATSAVPTSGTYTPTYTNTANVSSFTHQRAFYSVVDKVVHVTIKLVANVTSATAATSFEVTTPSTRSSSSFVLVTGSARGDLIAPVMTTGDTTTSAFVELKPPTGSTATSISVILNMSYEIP